MRSKVVSLQVGNFHVGKSWRLESERFTCLREGGGIMLGTTRYVGAPQHMLGTWAVLHMLGHHFICWDTNIYLHVYGRAGDYV